MPRQTPITPLDREANFRLDELFFSTTDRKGVITFGNDVFIRVSGYGPHDLVGAPHNIIRHRDMPRAAFQLVWEYLLAGHSAAAYVKNMAATGAYYWVLALITPIRDGFLSIRLKPSGPLFPIVQGVYAQMRDIEAKADAAGQPARDGMAQARAHLTAALASVGMRDYAELMDAILLTEVSARRHHLAARPAQGSALSTQDSSARHAACAALAAEVARLFARLDGLVALEKSLAGEVEFVHRLGRTLRLLSFNGQVRAAGLRDDGRTLQVIAGQMSSSALAIAGATREVCAAMAAVSAALKAAAAHIATADLAVETMGLFLAELAASAADASADGTGVRHRIAELAEVLEAKLAAACASADAAGAKVRQLEQLVDDFVKQIRTLEILHVTGRVEAVRCAEGAAVSTLFTEVYARTREARAQLDALADHLAHAHVEPPSPAVVAASLATLRAA